MLEWIYATSKHFSIIPCGGLPQPLSGAFFPSADRVEKT